MKNAFIALGLACVLALCGLSARANQTRKLNLLLITADDMNADSPGWMGSTLSATPNLDQLASTCHRFVNNHVTAPICQPSREAILTGLVPHHSGALGFNPVKPGTPTLVTILQAAGYYAAAINKTLHMKPIACFPWDDALEGSGKNPPLLREHFETTLQHATAAKKPFFINVNIQDPHRPFPGSNAKDEEEGTGKAAAKPFNQMRFYRPEEIKVPDFLEDIPPVRKEIAQYFTAVARLDIALKGVLDALTASGHDGDTLVLFMSDHGMSFPFSKATVYFNGTRSPVLLKYPGMPTATRHEELLSSVDILPTLLDLLKVSHPKDLDGRSWLPLLRGETQAARDYVITHVNTVSSGKSLAQRCIRTKDWALIFHAWPDGTAKFRVEAMGGITFKALETAGKTDERIAARVKQLRVGEPQMFFNQQTDPAERTNLIYAANLKSEIERLAKLLLGHMEKTNDPETANFKKALEDWNLRQKK